MDSIFFNSSTVLQNNILVYFFKDFNFNENSFSNSLIIQATSNKYLEIEIEKFSFNKTNSPINKSQYLIYIKCDKL